MKTFSFKMKLKPNCAAEYERRHNAIWPELIDLLKNEGIEEYIIFLDEETDTLFAVQKVSDKDSQSLGQNEIVKKWWAYMADVMETNDDNSPISIPLQKVFFLG